MRKLLAAFFGYFFIFTACPLYANTAESVTSQQVTDSIKEKEPEFPKVTVSMGSTIQTATGEVTFVGKVNLNLTKEDKLALSLDYSDKKQTLGISAQKKVGKLSLKGATEVRFDEAVETKLKHKLGLSLELSHGIELSVDRTIEIGAGSTAFLVTFPWN